MRFFISTVCAAVAAGLLAACSGANALSPTPAAVGPSLMRSTTEGGAGVGRSQTISLPCHCTLRSTPTAKKRKHF
jgi:hypothetical protein